MPASVLAAFEEQQHRFAGAAAAAFCFAVYVATLAPSITWRHEGPDSGDLVTAAYTLGIPHPTGYPLYTLVAAVFAHVGQGDPAYQVNLFSALAAAMAVFLLFKAIDLFVRARWESRARIPMAAAVALTFGFTPLFWSQAVIAEVYALNALIVAALLCILLSNHSTKGTFGAVVFGLGLAHHLLIVLLIPTALILIGKDRWTPRRILITAGLFLLPLLLYLYLPIRAMASPAVNWGNPRTLEGFLWTVSGAPYREYLLNLDAGAMLGRVALTARYLFDQFTFVGVALGVWGAYRTFSDSESQSRKRALALSVGLILIAGYSIIYASRDSYLYLIPGFMIFTLFLAYGFADLVGHAPSRWSAGLLIVLGLAAPTYNLVRNYSQMDLSEDRQAVIYAEAVAGAVPANAIVFADGDQHLFALWYYRFVTHREWATWIISPELLQYDWYYDGVRKATAAPRSPSAAWDSRVHAIIDWASTEKVPVYSTTCDGLFSGYHPQAMGDVCQITGGP